MFPPLDHNRMSASSESVLFTAVSPAPTTVLGTQQELKNCHISEWQAPKKAASAILLIIYPTDTVTHAQDQIYIVIHRSIVCNSKRLETLNIYQYRAGAHSLYCSCGMMVKISFFQTADRISSVLHSFKKMQEMYVFALHVHSISAKDLKKLIILADSGETNWNEE